MGGNFTFYDTAQPHAADIWRLLQTSAKAQSPLVLWSIQWLRQVLGDSPFVMRIPGLIFFWFAIGSIYWIVTKRESALCGTSAALFATSTGTFLYAAESRSYGVVIGAAALCLVCWMYAGRDGRPRWAPLALAASCCLVSASHYYAALTPCALALAETVRSYRRRQIDWPIWAAFCATAIPVVVFLPLIRGAKPLFANYWSPPQTIQLIHTFDFIIGPDRAAWLAILLIAVACVSRRGSGNDKKTIELHEWVALWSFVFLPFLAWPLAQFITHGYVEPFMRFSRLSESVSYSAWEWPEAWADPASFRYAARVCYCFSRLVQRLNCCVEKGTEWIVSMQFAT